MFPSSESDPGKPADDDLSSELEELNASDVTETEVSSKLDKDGDSVDLDSFYVDFASPPYQDMVKGAHIQPNKSRKGSPCVSDGIFKDFASRSSKKNVEKIHVPTREANDQKLSTNERIRLAGRWFIETYSSKIDVISELNHLSFTELSDDEAKDIKLLLTLLASAEMTGQRKFDRATKLIESCNNTSSAEGNPIERLVYYFSEAIREKINRGVGRAAHDGLKTIQMFDLQEVLMSVDTSILSLNQRLPLWRICQFSGIHTIIENLKVAKKIHIIDLEIRTGVKYIAMLQALASRCKKHLEHVKITAIGTRAKSKIKDTGKHLADFAESMNIPFSFKIVMVADVLDFNIDLVELDDDEKIAVYAPVFLSTLIVKPKHLEYLMTVIRKINPCITVIAEIEANHTSPAFADRFIDALFFYGALFDSLSFCLVDDDRSRRVTESVFMGQTIRNIVAAEGDERTIRHIGVDVWKTYFARFGMVEIELSEESLIETKLLIDNFDCENCCSIRVHGGCLLVDWEDVPVFSVSAWKFV
ncbi:hypothetical protein L2E82_06078 [Cichorium intybus]|uniref:Uncharacterized protein n=1 Tax=Cichorium intybus TaxID=13427 RepID=A0ACB9HA85_CICIN|nr:hypothetical protein L2E82_06078 [Cichorium intybus]